MVSKKLFLCLIIALVTFLYTGCGTSHQNLKLHDNFQLTPDYKIKVGAVTNETNKSFGDVDVIGIFKDSLINKLQKENLLAVENSRNVLVLNTKIIEYEEGSAFKRWLLPGYGSTIMAINADLKDNSTGKLIGSIDARKTISFGGGFSIGAWKTVISDIANDIVEKIKEEHYQKK